LLPFTSIDVSASLPSASTFVPPPIVSATLCAVSCSCAPLIASRLVALTAPAPTPVSTRSPAVPPKFTDVPSVSFATVISRVSASCWTRPIEPLTRLLEMFSIASPTLLYFLSLTVYVGFVTLPFASTVEPPPSASATLFDAPYSCEPFTASMLVAFTAPALTFDSVVPSAPFSVIWSKFAEPFACLSYVTASDVRPAPGFDESIGATRPASCNWPRLIAS